MGITNFSLELLQPVIDLLPLEQRAVFELGSQQTYVAGDQYGKFSDWFYKQNGFVDIVQIDLNGENNSFKMDLSDYRQFGHFWGVFPLVTDFGTSEHVSGPSGKHDLISFYNCWIIKLLACSFGGYIVSENPLTGHWPGHGCNYVCEDFYIKLAEWCNLEIITIGVHYAMGNVTDGANVFCVLRKNSSFVLPDFTDFIDLPIFDK